MQRSSAPVKPAGQTGDLELDLLRKRLARREANYQKLCTTIERTQRKLDKADRTVTRCVKQLTKLERQRRRAEKAKAEAEALLATELTPKPPIAEAIPPKPKRERKPKAKVSEVTDIPNSEIFGDQLDAAIKKSWNASVKEPLKAKGGKPSSEDVKAEREKRMTSMGFRRTSKQRQTATDADTR